MVSPRAILELTRRYTEPHRHYHDIRHIAWILHQARGLRLSDEQILAIWFHDAVYDPRSDTNERDSARLAEQLLAAEGYAPAAIDLVAAIILDTEQHVATCPEAEIVIDLDLGPLGVEWDEYLANTAKLEREFAHLPPAERLRQRRAFCESILARPRIYTTDWGRPREQRARDNLRRSLQTPPG